MNYLTENLAGFFNLLRASGMNISVSDCLAAVEALEYIEATSRLQVRTALNACLAKDKQGRDILARAFDLYFVPGNIRKEYVDSKASLIEMRKQEIKEAAESLKFQDSSLELSDDFKEVFAGLPEEEKKALKDYLDKASSGKNVRTEFKQLAEGMVRGKLTNLKTSMTNC